MESVTTMLTLRSALRKRKSYKDPVAVDENFIDLVEYQNYYSLMVVNFASPLTRNIEKIFYKFIVERKRRDIIVITMKDIELHLKLMADSLKHNQFAPIIEEGDEEEEAEVETNDSEISIDQMVMVIKTKIEAAVQENDRILAQREALAKFRILEYWKTGVGISTESLAIEPGPIRDSTRSSEKGPERRQVQKPKPKKSRKSKTSIVEEPANISPIGMGTDEFIYIIPEYDFVSQIWSKLTQRGQEQFDKIYIEDFPLLGPKIYVILLNFCDIDLMIRLIEDQIYLNSIIQILPYGEIDVKNTWNLIDMNKRRLDIFKTVSFFEHYITFSDKPIICYIDKMNAYNLICYMFYDADDIRRRHENFLENCNLINLEEEIHAIVNPSEIQFLFSNEIEFYVINLFIQIIDDEFVQEEEEESNDFNELNPSLPTPPPIMFTLYNERIMIVEDSYNFLKMNHSLDNFDRLNAIYYNYISNMNQTNFNLATKGLIEEFDIHDIKFIKHLTKYAFHELIFKLNATCNNKQNHYRLDYYEVAGADYRILHYKYHTGWNCEEKLCYTKTVVPTKLCHRDFNEYLVDEIQPWLEKQEFLYSDLLQSFMYEKYLSDLPRHIEFQIKYVKEQNFIYEPSIKMEIHMKQQHDFQSLKQKEYDKVFEYIDRKSASLPERDSTGLRNSLTRKKIKKLKKPGVDELLEGTPRPSATRNLRRISEIQPFDDIDAPDLLEIDLNFFHKHSHTIPDIQKSPKKAFNVYDLGDTRYQIDVTERKFHFRNGSVHHCLDDILYREKYQSIRLRFCWNRFYLNRIFLADQGNAYYLTDNIRIITENDTTINLHISYVDEYHTGWTRSSTALSTTPTLEEKQSAVENENFQLMFNVNVVMHWPNGLKVHIGKDEELNQTRVEQEWCEVEGRDNESRRWYYSNGCCVAFCLDFVVKVYTSFGVLYEIGGIKEEEETALGIDSLGDYVELQQKYDLELNYLSFLSNVVGLDYFNLTLPNGCKIFVQNQKIVKYLSQKPDKLLVKEHIDYVLGEILLRREDGFKMLFSATEQIVIYPDGTIVKTGQLQLVESIEETSFSDVTSGQSENDLIAGGHSIVSYFVKQVIKFSTSDHYQFVNRKYLYFFHENYSTVQWDIEANKISFDNYDRSINIVYNNAQSISGTLKNNFGHSKRPGTVEDLMFTFDPDRMSIDHNGFSSKINFHYKNEENIVDEHVLMKTLDLEYLNQMEIMDDGTVNVHKNISDKCIYKMDHPQKQENIKLDDRTFLLFEGDENHYYELFMDDIDKVCKGTIIKNDDSYVLVLKDLNTEVNSSFKSSSDLFGRIPDRLATKPDNICKLDEGTLEIHEEQIKKNFFNKLSNRFGFEYFQKYLPKKALKSYYCDDKRIAKLCENAIKNFVDQEYQNLVDARDEKRGRLRPSEVFVNKMREIEARHQLASNYRIMLRYNIVPKYFDFHEHGDHIKNMDVSKYIKRPSKVRYCLEGEGEEK